ncbi:unnamed protein product [Larinioides sclopetarius]|uniref:U3 small nucleolar RNA-associated protein 14 n=1 Tax=Larinioides sclopetarius TaxID=280406 RepID=A0AAV2BVF5_9ARAC
MKKKKQTKSSKRSVLEVQSENSNEMLDASDVPMPENGNENIDSSSLKNKKKFKKKAAQRSEASLNVSEFDLNEVGKETIKLNELIKTSQKLSGAGLVKKQLEKVKKLQSLAVPLSKPQMTKIKRTMGYTKVCDELKRWEPVVHRNRSAEQVIFPLKKPEVQLETFEKASEKYVLKHPVAIAVDELLKKSENVLQKDKPMTEAEEKALKAMSLEEAKQRHAELMRHRALVSYQEAKARRQNKIKSKRYHRLLKKEKMKKLMKEFEELEKTDSAKALEKLMEADKLRVLERMTLKHRNTGKWAKMQKLRAKYNPEARSQLKEDLQIGLKLKEKLPTVQKNISKLKADLQRGEADEPDEDEIHFGSGSDMAPVTELLEEASIPNFAQDDVATDAKDQETEALIDKLCIVKDIQDVKPKKKSTRNTNKKDIPDIIDVNFITKASNLDSYNPSGISIGDAFDEIENDDDENNEKSGGMDISEALADEEIIEEFKEDKRAAEEASRPKGIDLFLPGWGSWAGAGIKVSKKRRRRFFIPPPEEPAPKKSTLGNVIMNEDRDKKAAVHQVNTLPFPFSNINQFESYIRQPVGHTWNPPSSFRSLTEPRVVTKAGKVIEPIDPEDVVLDNTTKKEPQKKKRRKNATHEIKAF